VFLLFVISKKFIFLACFFHDAVITDNYTTSNNGVNDEEGQGYGIIEAGHYPDIWLEGLTQTTEKSVRTGVHTCSISLVAVSQL